ncbi:hypothetical protein K435DRAFT_870744 [Dendrothele bispora CBS 962.96]|uniref:Uncharacterized protein n=1 Tax=Dendrothele bispora (strain CBS 962.96) TaxID=1314807 RepID=A0A4V6T531_DENBC|nr:hypothetical protein K435DRAFT_870744 [Dendrothele bispora CBS 962.96]
MAKSKSKPSVFTNEEAETAWPELPLPADELNYPKVNGNANFNPRNKNDIYWLEMQKTQWIHLQQQKGLSMRPELPLESLEVAFKECKIRQYERCVSEKDRPDHYQKKIKQYFVNRKRDMPSSQTPVPTFMFTSTEQGPDSASGFSLFEQSVKDAVNEETNQWRQTNGLDFTHHVGHYKSLLSKRWNGLSEEERSKYTADAVVLKRQQSAPEDIYQNQMQTVNFIQATLLRSIGHGAGQIGNASYYLMMAYRDDKDEIQNWAATFGPSFVDYVGKEVQNQLQQQWLDFANKNVLSNKSSLMKQNFERNQAGRFLLMSSETFSKSNSGGHEAYLQFLKDFLRVSWEHDFVGATAPSWEALIQQPDYLRSEIHKGQTLVEIDTKHSRLYAFMDSILDFQSEYPDESIFNPSRAVPGLAPPASLARGSTPSLATSSETATASIVQPVSSAMSTPPAPLSVSPETVTASVVQPLSSAMSASLPPPPTPPETATASQPVPSAMASTFPTAQAPLSPRFLMPTTPSPLRTITGQAPLSPPAHTPTTPSPLRTMLSFNSSSDLSIGSPPLSPARAFKTLPPPISRSSIAAPVPPVSSATTTTTLPLQTAPLSRVHMPTTPSPLRRMLSSSSQSLPGASTSALSSSPTRASPITPLPTPQTPALAPSGRGSKRKRSKALPDTSQTSETVTPLPAPETPALAPSGRGSNHSKRSKRRKTAGSKPQLSESGVEDRPLEGTEGAEETQTTHRSSARMRKPKDRNADNQYTGSPAHKRK